MDWKHFEEFENEVFFEFEDNIKVLCWIDSLDMNGSICKEYRVLTYRPKTNKFLDWNYNSSGKFESTLYPNNSSTILKYVIIKH